MKQQRRHYSEDEKAKISLEAIGCQLQSTLEKQNALEERQKRGCCGSTELAIIVARRSWREFLCGKLRIGTKRKKEHQRKKSGSGSISY